MIKKVYFAILTISAVLLMVSASFADETPREGTPSEGKTTFGNIAVVGLNKSGTNGTTNPGVPGYIEMVSTAGNKYYIYVDNNGSLKIASEADVGYGASPSTVSWADASGSLVATQTD